MPYVKAFPLSHKTYKDRWLRHTVQEAQTIIHIYHYLCKQQMEKGVAESATGELETSEL